ncbi:MAG TPA: sulfur carrier protein ThiS [Candidatus Binataceae bacterium]|nr:sulfur carrier protein ThiS [Candidatus Binataceae bacterium]
MSDDFSFSIQLNGETRPIGGDPHLVALIERLKLRRGRIAVELNHAVVPKAEWDAIVLRPGDQLEIVNFVGGG